MGQIFQFFHTNNDIFLAFETGQILHERANATISRDQYDYRLCNTKHFTDYMTWP